MMHLSIVSLFALYGLTAGSVVTKQSCSTKFGNSSIKNVPTSTVTIHTDSVESERYCPTPGKTTITVTETNSAGLSRLLLTKTVTKTNIYTVTNTDVRTTKVTSTQTTTSTKVVTPTKTKPPPRGFTPIPQQPDYVPRRKRSLIDSRGMSLNANGNVIFHEKAYEERDMSNQSLYPEVVDCRKTIETVSTRTYTDRNCGSGKTVTETTTITPTPRNPKCAPYITSTVTVSGYTTKFTTSTQTSSVITTKTITKTSTAPTVTFYAACAPTNIVGHANGNEGISFIIFGDGNPQFTAADTSYDCCALCFQETGCVYAAWAAPGENGCILIITDGQCDPSDGHNTWFYTNSDTPADEGLILANGPCGHVENDGTTTIF